MRAEASEQASEATGERQRARYAVPVLVVVATIALGLPEGSMGVLWPSISADLGQPLAAAGILLYAYAGGYLLAALAHGTLAKRLPTPALLCAGAALGLVGALGFAASPVFVLCAAAYFTIGLAGGNMDAANNSYVALNHGHRLLALMHGGFGVGALVGPAAVGVLLHHDVSWRVALLGLAAYELVLLVMFAVFRAHFGGRTATGRRFEDIDIPITGESLAPAVDPGDAGEAPGLHAAPRHGRRAMFALSLLSFFAYTGVEVGVGFWGYSLLVDRGIDAGQATFGIVVYWSALTVGRFSIAAIGRRVTPRQVLAAAIIGAIAGTLLLWAGGAGSTPSTGLSIAALVVIGGSLAGIFPSLVALTPDRLGTEGAAAAIGWQLATASLGGSTTPAIIGVVATRVGVSAIAPSLVVAALLLAAVHAVATLVDVRNRRQTGPAVVAGP